MVNHTLTPIDFYVRYRGNNGTRCSLMSKFSVDEDVRTKIRPEQREIVAMLREQKRHHICFFAR